MTIEKKQDGASLRISLEGRLDTTTSPSLEEVLKTSLDGISDLVFDFTKLEYISSAGLRLLLWAQKTMNKQGQMAVEGANASIREVFEITGFEDILTIR